MSRYLLDTSIISNVTKPSPSELLLSWMAAQVDEDLFISSLTIAEIWRAVLEKPAGRKRDQLETWFTGAEGPSALFAGRVLAFDEQASLIWARLMAGGRATGRSLSALDTIIAATAITNDCIVVTDNECHFPDVQILNPLRSARTTPPSQP